MGRSAGPDPVSEMGLGAVDWIRGRHFSLYGYTPTCYSSSIKPRTGKLAGLRGLPWLGSRGWSGRERNSAGGRPSASLSGLRLGPRRGKGEVWGLGSGAGPSGPPPSFRCGEGVRV